MSRDRKIIYVLICLGIITINFNLAAIAAVIPTLGKEFNLPDFVVSKVITYYMLPYGVAALLYAPLTRYLTYKVTLATTLGLYALASLFCGLTHSFGWFLWSNVVMGMTAAAAIPLGLMVIGQLFEKDIRGRLVGTFFSCAFLASMAGILITGFASWRTLFFIPAATGILSCGALLVWPVKLLDQVHQAPVNYLKAITDRHIRNVFLFIFVMSFLYHAVHKWYGVYLSQEYHLNKSVISIFFIITSLSGAAGQNVGGYLTDKRGRFWTCRTGTALLGLATMLLVGHYPLVILAVILAALSVGWTINHNGISTVLTDFSDDERPMIAGLNSSVRFVSGGIGFYISHFFVQKSFGYTFLGVGIVMLGAAVFLKYIVTQK